MYNKYILDKHDSPGLTNANDQPHVEHTEEEQLDERYPDEGRKEYGWHDRAQQQVHHAQDGVQQRLQ